MTTNQIIQALTKEVKRLRKELESKDLTYYEDKIVILEDQLAKANSNVAELLSSNMILEQELDNQNIIISYLESKRG